MIYCCYHSILKRMEIVKISKLKLMFRVTFQTTSRRAKNKRFGLCCSAHLFCFPVNVCAKIYLRNYNFYPLKKISSVEEKNLIKIYYHQKNNSEYFKFICNLTSRASDGVVLAMSSYNNVLVPFTMNENSISLPRYHRCLRCWGKLI